MEIVHAPRRSQEFAAALCCARTSGRQKLTPQHDTQPVTTRRRFEGENTPCVSARPTHRLRPPWLGFRLGTSDRPTRRAQRGGANFEHFWVGRPDRPTLFHRQRWVGSRFSGVSANFTRPTDSAAPDSPLSGWVGPPARPTLSAAAPGRKVYFQLRTAQAKNANIIAAITKI